MFLYEEMKRVHKRIDALFRYEPTSIKNDGAPLRRGLNAKEVIINGIRSETVSNDSKVRQPRCGSARNAKKACTGSPQEIRDRVFVSVCYALRAGKRQML